MPVEYHLWLDDEVKGPYTIGQLKGMWSSGLLTGETLFSTGGENWNPLRTISFLLEPAAPLPAVSTPQINPEYQTKLKQYLAAGWVVLSEGESGAQLQAPKQMGVGLVLSLILGVLLLLLYGAGLILLIAVAIGYNNQTRKTYFLPRNIQPASADPFVAFKEKLFKQDAAYTSFTDKELRRMFNDTRTNILIFILVAGISACGLRGDDITTLDGKTYKGATVSSKDPISITVLYSDGGARLFFTNLSPELQKKYGYDPVAAQKWQIDETQQKQIADAIREKQKQAALKAAAAADANDAEYIAKQRAADAQTAKGNVVTIRLGNVVYTASSRIATKPESQ